MNGYCKMSEKAIKAMKDKLLKPTTPLFLPKQNFAPKSIVSPKLNFMPKPIVTPKLNFTPKPIFKKEIEVSPHKRKKPNGKNKVVKVKGYTYYK